MGLGGTMTSKATKDLVVGTVLYQVLSRLRSARSQTIEFRRHWPIVTAGHAPGTVQGTVTARLVCTTAHKNNQFVHILLVLLPLYWCAGLDRTVP
jgi:hypothetical protein